MPGTRGLLQEVHSATAFRRRPKRGTWLATGALALLLGSASMHVAAQGTPARPGTSPNGQAVYVATCSNCHDEGVSGAPRVGDRAYWATRTPEWTAVLVSHATSGFITMNPKGGYRYLSDQDVADAVIYIADRVKPSASGLSEGAVKGTWPYLYACSNCHDSGLGGAPKLGDTAAWAERSMDWKSVLKHHATNGFVRMAPKGGFSHLSDAEVAAAVDYMVYKAK